MGVSVDLEGMGVGRVRNRSLQALIMLRLKVAHL